MRIEEEGHVGASTVTGSVTGPVIGRPGFLLVNFGGPRTEEEVAPFLRELLIDRDVVRSGLPAWLHNPLFKAIATWRARRIREEYRHMGGKSPIYEQTQWLAEQLSQLPGPVWTFHRYLSATHPQFLGSIEAMQKCSHLIVFPLFPQYSYATTGSIARWMERHLPPSLSSSLRWIRSYCDHPLFIKAYGELLRVQLKQSGWEPSEVAILCSFHGLPESFVKRGDPYPVECTHSFNQLQALFPSAVWKMSYQSKFGPGQWLKPATDEVCEKPLEWTEGRKKVIIVPLAFTSDHIETLSEIENLYLPPLRKNGLEAIRLSALNQLPLWVEAVKMIIQETESSSLPSHSNRELIPPS